MKNANTRIEFEFAVDRHTAQTLDVWTIGDWPGVSAVSAESFAGNWVKARATAKALRRLAVEINADFLTLIKLEGHLADELERVQVLKEVPESFTYALDCIADVSDCDDSERRDFIDTCYGYRLGPDFVAVRYGHAILWRQGGKEQAVTCRTAIETGIYFDDLCARADADLEKQIDSFHPGARQRLSGLAERVVA